MRERAFDNEASPKPVDPGGREGVPERGECGTLLMTMIKHDTAVWKSRVTYRARPFWPQNQVRLWSGDKLTVWKCSVSHGVINNFMIVCTVPAVVLGGHFHSQHR